MNINTSLPAASSQTSSSSGTTSNTNASSPNQLTSSDFLKLFLTELQYQDPTQPMDTSQMLSQEAQLTTVQEMTDMTTSLKNMQTEISGNQVEQGAALIGQTVNATAPNGSTIKGPVSGVGFQSDGSMIFTVNGQDVTLSQIKSIGTVVAPSSSSSTNPTTSQSPTSNS